jgi:hypothetical protein
MITSCSTLDSRCIFVMSSPSTPPALPYPPSSLPESNLEPTQEPFKSTYLHLEIIYRLSPTGLAAFLGCGCVAQCLSKYVDGRMLIGVELAIHCTAISPVPLRTVHRKSGWKLQQIRNVMCDIYSCSKPHYMFTRRVQSQITFERRRHDTKDVENMMTSTADKSVAVERGMSS